MTLHSSSWQSAKKRVITLSCATALSFFAAATISTASADEVNTATNTTAITHTETVAPEVSTSENTATATVDTEQATSSDSSALSDTADSNPSGITQNTDGSYSYYDSSTGEKVTQAQFLTLPASSQSPAYTIYIGADGNLVNDFNTIDGNLYYFDNYRLTINSPFTINGQNYVSDIHGYVTEVPKNDYYTVNGNWYYADENGKNLTGAHTINGQEVYFNAQGVQAKGIFDGTGFNQYYYDQDTGAKWTNRFVEWDGSWYYLNAKGRRATGLQTINGQTLYFGVTSAEGTGKQVKGKLTSIYDDNDASHLYYFDQDTGDMWKNRYVQWEGSWYYLGSEGYALTNGENTINGDVVYFHTDGKQAKGELITENGTTRYYDQYTGARASNTTRVINGTTYYFDAQGNGKIAS